jgi:DHA1 family multidrug resistance protein-like MFS transporter
MSGSSIIETENQKFASRKQLWLAVYWVSYPFGILSFVLPIYGKELGASALEIGGFFSAFSLIPVIVRPFLGRALDRYGRRPFLLFGLLGYLLSMIIFCFANSILLLTIARFVQGVGAAFLWISAYTMVADLANVSGRGYDFGIIDEAANRGGIIGTLIGFFATIGMANIGLEWKWIWPILFIGYTIPAGLGFWKGWRGVMETRPDEDLTGIKSRPVSRQLITLMCIVLFTGASQAMVWPLLMVFLQDILKAEVWSLAIAYLPAALIGAFLPSRAGRIADRFGRKGPMIMGLVIGACVSLIIPNLRSIIGLTALWAFESAGYVAAIPAERAFVADIAGQDVRGTSYGLYTFAYFLGAFLGPLAGGWLYDHEGHASPFYLNSIVLLIGAALVATLLRETRPKLGTHPI